MSTLASSRGSDGNASAGGHPSPDAIPARGDRPRSSRRELALTLVTLALVAGAAAGFIRAQTLKLEPSPLDRARVEATFSPLCKCRSKAAATLAFTVRRAVRLDAEMIDADGRPVRTLAEDLRWSPGRRRLLWNGRDDAGRLVPDGPYRLRVRLLGADGREIVLPTPVVLDTEPPEATLVSVAPRVAAQAPDGRTLAEPVDVRYETSEAGAQPVLLVDGRRAARLGPRVVGPRAIAWDGRARGRAVEPGPHTLAVRLRDRAGNTGPASRSVRVGVEPAGRAERRARGAERSRR